MALAINQQFTRFVEFASGDNAHGMDSIARAGAIAQGGIFAGRAIKEAEGDSIGKIRRSDDLQRENDMARKLFRQSVVEIFGGEAKIPKSVKDAMKLKDYDQGKPLTARRILAVKAAIDVYAARAAEAFDRAKAAATAAYFYGRPGAPVSPEKRARIDRVLTVAVNAAVTDTDALDIVVACGKSIVETGERNLRSEDEIKARVAKLLDNVAELKAVAKGNQAVLRAGLEFLRDMRGKAVPEGMIRTLVQTSMKLSLSAVKSLKADSSGMELHEAVVQLYDNVTKAMEAAGTVRVTGTEGDVKVRFRNFCVLLMMGRLGDGLLPGIKTLLEGKGKVLNAFYGDIAGNFHIDGVDPALREYMQRPAQNFGDIIEKFYWQLQVRQGLPEEEIQAMRFMRDANYVDPDRPNYVDIDAMDVAADIRDHAGEFMRSDRDMYLKNKVGGNGRGAGKVRALFDKALPQNTYDPNNRFNITAKETVSGLLNRNLCKRRKNCPDADNARDAGFHAPFANRLFSVELPGGVVLDPDNYEDAYDKLASFITRGAKNAVGELDGHEKKKLLTIIALIDDNICDAAEKGVKLALDPNGRDDGKLALQRQNATCRFSLYYDDLGDRIVVKCEREYDLAQLRVRNDQGAMENVNFKPGSKLVAGHSIKIPAAELDRLADLDFSAYDDAPVQQRIDDPNVEKPYQNIKQHLGEGFGFKTA